MRLPIFLILTIFLMGCSATRQPMTYDNTNIRLERIERNILQKNQEMEDIKYSIEELSNKIDQVAGYAPGTSDVMSNDYVPDVSNEADMGAGSDSGKIIRVPVSEKDVQIALKNAGYYDGAIDGKIGKKTIQAIKDFQKDFDLKVDGIIGRQTWAEIKKYLE